MRLTVTRFIILLTASVVSTKTNAQLSINSFLNSASSDVSLKIFDEQINYLKDKPYRLSPLKGLSLRVQNNELNSINDRYGVRVNPANPLEIRRNNQYYTAFRESLELERDIALKKVLEDRYTLIIDYFYYAELKSLLEKDKTFLESQLLVLEKQQFSDFFNVEDFVHLKLDQMSKSVELDVIENDISNQVSNVGKANNSQDLNALNWDLQSVISVARIEKIIDSLLHVDVTSSSLAYEDKRIILAQREYALEKSNFDIGFVQAQYTNGRTIENKNPWGLSVGVNIPITNPNKGDMAKSHLDVIEAKNEKLDTENTLQVDRKSKVNKLRNSIARYNDMQQKINSLKVGPLSNTLNSISGNNPIVIIKFNSNILKLQVVLLKLKQSISYAYIDFLKTYDLLQQKPLINYLSATLNKIDEN